MQMSPPVKGLEIQDDTGNAQYCKMKKQQCLPVLAQGLA